MGEVRHVLPSGGRGSCGTSSKRKGEVAEEGWGGIPLGGGGGGGGRRTRNRNHIYLNPFLWTCSSKEPLRPLALNPKPERNHHEPKP